MGEQGTHSNAPAFISLCVRACACVHQAMHATWPAPPHAENVHIRMGTVFCKRHLAAAPAFTWERPQQPMPMAQGPTFSWAPKKQLCAL